MTSRTTTLSLAFVIHSILISSSFAEVTTDGSVGQHPGQTFTGDNIDIDSTHGDITGNNLFHSFSEFSIAESQTVNFSHSGAETINNVISRVTGPNASNIDGTLSSSIAGANFFLLNPNGIMFGPNATVNISGSFHATTADYLKFGDDKRYYADLTKNTELSIAAPSDFGFLDNTVSNIDIFGSNLELSEGNSHSFVGGNINIDAAPMEDTNNAVINSNNGEISLVSIVAQGEISLDSDNIKMDSISQWGDITLDHSSSIDTSGSSAGRIVIRGGGLILDNNSHISANSDETIVSTSTPNAIRNIDISTTDSILFNHNSGITNNIQSINAEQTAGIALASNSIKLDNQSFIKTNTNGINNSGDTIIEAGLLQLEEFSEISSESSYLGNGGNIDLNADLLDMKSGGHIISTSYADGDAGNIEINSENILITGPSSSISPFGIDFTGIRTSKYGELSEGGNITIINEKDLTLSSRSEINMVNAGALTGGTLAISSQSLNILEGSRLGVDALYTLNGNGADLVINSDTINVDGQHDEIRYIGILPSYYDSEIYSIGPDGLFPDATGDTGKITINSSDLNISGSAKIISLSSQSTGNPGVIDISTDNLTLDGINTTEYQELINAGFVESDAYSRASSNITIRNSYIDFFFTGESPSSIGEINIQAKNISVKNGGHISTQTSGDADSGNLNIDTKNLHIETGGIITSSATNGNGDAGLITINSDFINIDGNSNLYTNSGIYSNTDEFGEHSGGDIDIITRGLKLSNKGIISSETASAGQGGNISIESENFLVLTDESEITTKATDNSSGSAGHINLDTSLFVLDNSYITTSAISGAGGNITISAYNLIITQNSDINAESEESVSGIINIISKRDVVSNLDQLTVESENVADKFKSSCKALSTSDSNFNILNKPPIISFGASIQPSNYIFYRSANHSVVDYNHLPYLLSWSYTRDCALKKNRT